MKIRLIKYCPLVLAFALGFSVCAVAVPNLEPVTAYLNYGLSVEFNDVDQVMTDEAGSRVIPLTYNNTTYLPVRAVANMLGVKVGWHQESQTVLLGDSYPDAVQKQGLSDQELRNLANKEFSKICSEDLGCTFSSSFGVYKFAGNPNIVSVGTYNNVVNGINTEAQRVFFDRITGKVLWHEITFGLNDGFQAFLLKNNLLTDEEKKSLNISPELVDIILNARTELEREYSFGVEMVDEDWAYIFSRVSSNSMQNVYAVEFNLHHLYFSKLNKTVIVYVDASTNEVIHLRDCSNEIFQEDLNFWNKYGFEHK